MNAPLDEGTIADVLAGRAAWAVVCGDAVEVLREIPEGALDVVWTDPPYCSGGFLETAKRQARGMLPPHVLRRVGWFINDNMGTTGLAWLLRAVALQAARALKPSGHLGFFADHRMIDAIRPAVESSGLRYSNLLVWDKMQPGLGKGFRAQHEIVLHFVGRLPVYHSGSEGNVQSVRRVNAKKRNHQTAKPPELVARHLRVVTPPGGIVLDPFVGGAGVGRAALRIGARFIGADINPETCETARQALREEMAELKGRDDKQSQHAEIPRLCRAN